MNQVTIAELYWGKEPIYGIMSCVTMVLGGFLFGGAFGTAFWLAYKAVMS